MIAFCTRSDGGSGFSFEASLIGLWIMSSRSSSSIGLPGSYGAMPRMCSFAIDSHCVGMRSPLQGRVRSENLQEQGPLTDLPQYRRDRRCVAMALDVHEDHVLPGPLLGRPRFDLREIDPQSRERLEDPVERARLVAHGEEDRSLVVSRRTARVTADDQKARGVVRVVLDGGSENRHVVELPRQV